MYRLFLTLAGLMVATATTPALAQDQGRGAYAVGRIGVVADSDLKFRKKDRTVASTFPSSTDLKPGFIGEVGSGYDFGAFRLEGTIGYSQVKLDRKRAAAGFLDDGRARSLNLGLSAYADIPTGGRLVPYVGAGIGASRVDARLARVTTAPVASSRFRDKDWGFQWHVDAGLAYQVSERTAVELGARYTRTSALRFEGANGTVGADFKPQLASTSVMLGIRQGF